MKLPADPAQFCIYRRSGYENVLLRFSADGTTSNPPGHAEARWELSNSGEVLQFSTEDGVCTARLQWDGRRYNGVLLGWIDASLEIYPAKGFAPTAWSGTDDEALRELTVVTVADKFTPGFARLWDSCRHWNITPLVLGFGSEFGGMTSKVHLLYRALVALAGSLKTVMFLDGFDTLVTAPASAILRTFRDFGRPLIFSAERNCFPEPDRSERYPPVPTPYRFLNSGTFIGNARYLLWLLARWDAAAWPADASDQLLLTDAFLANTSALALDYECRLFQCMHSAEGDVEVDENGFRNLVTGTRPLIVHANGSSDMSKAVEWFDRVTKTAVCC